MIKDKVFICNTNYFLANQIMLHNTVLSICGCKQFHTYCMHHSISNTPMRQPKPLQQDYTINNSKLNINQLAITRICIVIKGTRIIIQYAIGLFVYIRFISDAQIKIVIMPIKYKVDEH